MDFKDAELRNLIVARFDKPHHRCLENNHWAQAKTWDVRSSSCADHLQITVVIDKGKIQKACFSGQACAIAIASTDLLMEKILGQDLAQIHQIIHEYRQLIDSGPVKEIDEKVLDNLIAFKNIYRQRNRKACALMGADGLEQLLASYDK